MSVNKFGKNRSVDHRYYNVPYKYIVNSQFKGGSNNGQTDKDLCIVDFFGKYALVGYRNGNRATISMPKLCKIIKKKGKWYFMWHGKKVLYSDTSGWVY